MIQAQFRLAAVLLSFGLAAPGAPVDFMTFPGEATDLAPGGGANGNRLGGFFSDLYYDPLRNQYYGLVDRGPGGGVYRYDTRVQRFTLRVDPATGAVDNFQLQQTLMLRRPNGERFNGQRPDRLNGDGAVLGLSFDPEGIAVGANGHLYVSDEYGPSLYEFSGDGVFVRGFQIPDRLLPRDDTGAVDFAETRRTDGNPDGIVSGRQDNRGFEGLAVSPDGSRLYTLLQGPLQEEGSSDGRFSRNLRLVEFDTRTGQATRQFIYPLESLTDINDRISGTGDDFGADAQGRTIGISAIVALSDHEFLVLERDNRGIGVDDPLGSTAVGSKRIYRIDLTGATDVTPISLAGANDLPAGVTPVAKSLFLDLASALAGAALPIAEKIEGLTVGPRLSSGAYALLVGTDNDFSVTQRGASNDQFNVCTNGTTSAEVAIDTPCPAGFSLLPTYLYSFATPIIGYQAPIPAPATLLLAAGLGSLLIPCSKE